MPRVRRTHAVLATLVALTVPACTGPSEVTDEDGSTRAAAGQRFPDVVQASLEPEDGGTFTVEVTMSSPYDTPERYADGWRVSSRSGDELGNHTLTHDHAEEQPFTRSQSGLEVPDDVDSVVVEGHDSENGYGGGTVTVEVPR